MVFLVARTNPWAFALLGWTIVFIALLFLVGIFLIVPKIIRWGSDRKMKVIENGKEVVKDADDISGEISAVIATALKLFLDDKHDKESNVITIKQVQKRYSPWNSKLYGMKNTGFSQSVSNNNRYSHGR